MAPDPPAYSKKPRQTEKSSQLICRVKYNNGLPDIPFDPKFISYPFDNNRFVQYNPTSLERSHQSDLLTEHDLGVKIDLVDPDAYKEDPDVILCSDDERLLEEEVSAYQKSKRSARHNRTVSWLRKTEYISTEYNRFQQKSDKAESRIGHNLKKILGEEVMYKDRDSQIKAIEHGFEQTQEEILHHHSKPGVTPVEVLPVFPDFQMWGHPCAQVIFDSDPAPLSGSKATQNEAMSQAMIRGMVDESGEQFVAYFLPSEETLGKRKRDAESNTDYEEGDEYEHYLAREYNWNVKNKLSKGYEETYFFVWRDDGMYYNELETRVRLSKRRKLGAAPVNKSQLIVRHRPMTDTEVHAEEQRLSMLEPAEEEEEEPAFEGVEDDVQKDDDDAQEENADAASNASEAGEEGGISGSDDDDDNKENHSVSTDSD